MLKIKKPKDVAKIRLRKKQRKESVKKIALEMGREMRRRKRLLELNSMTREELMHLTEKVFDHDVTKLVSMMRYPNRYGETFETAFNDLADSEVQKVIACIMVREKLF
jgi:hypothetical protein